MTKSALQRGRVQVLEVCDKLLRMRTLAQKGVPMKKGGFGGRRNELEEKFFAERDRELVQALREKTATQERKGPGRRLGD
jgi:hypothetical protein